MNAQIEAGAEAIRQTREFQAGAAFGLPQDAYRSYASALAQAAWDSFHPTITTHAGVVALPFDTVLRDDTDYIMEKQADGEGGYFWASAGCSNEYTDADIDLPANVLHMGDQP